MDEHFKILKEAFLEMRDASIQSHTGHWDMKGTHGLNCPECIRARELRKAADVKWSVVEKLFMTIKEGDAECLTSPKECQFDKDGICQARACYSGQKCNSRDAEGSPIYATFHGQLQEYDREAIMKQWDYWRKIISDGFKGSAPRDWFESVLDYFEEKFQTPTESEDIS